MNNVLRFKRGDLRKKAQQRNLLHEFVLDVDADNVSDVEIITLQQHLKDHAVAEAWVANPDPQTVDDTISQLLETKYNTAQEFVKVEPGRITIGVNSQSVDDNAVDRAMILMIQVDDITKQQTTTFGEAIIIHG